MKTKPEKAKALLSLLGARSKDILSLMSPEATQLLTSSLGSQPHLTPKEVASLIKEVESEINRFKFGDPEETTSKVEPKNEDDPFLNDLQDDEFLDDEKGMDLEDDVDPIPPRDPSLRSPEKIASLLQKEKVQITAFLMSKMEESERDEILSVMESEYKQQVISASVDSVPLNDSIYEKIYTKICKKTVEESLEEDGGDITF
jgi:flagellar motor switch protein FliG